jgi:hypothetical protein
MLPGGDQRNIAIQGREQPAARPGSLPPQREHGGLTAGHQFQEMHLDQLGHARRGTQRADPDQASKAITVGSLRHGSQQPAASQIREPGRRGREAQIQQHLASYEYLPSRPGKMITLARDQSPHGPTCQGRLRGLCHRAPAPDPAPRELRSLCYHPAARCALTLRQTRPGDIPGPPFLEGQTLAASKTRHPPVR